MVVGVNPDAEIRQFKGPPVMNDDERCALVEAVKWVDEVIPSALLMTTRYISSCELVAATTFL